MDALQPHDIVDVTDGPYAGMSGIVADVDDGTVCVHMHGFAPLAIGRQHVKLAGPAPFYARSYDGDIGQKIAVEIELAKACRGLRHVIHHEAQHERVAACLSCGEQVQLELGV